MVIFHSYVKLPEGTISASSQVLNGLSLQIKAKEKIGICGRTGAGKSSILNVLLRIVDAESGSVKVRLWPWHAMAMP
jgi:ABC-type multidrug transport system fused ATPase/permease subunit